MKKMAQTIFKYLLNLQETHLELPVGSSILTVKYMNEGAMLWALINKNENVMEIRRIVCFGTGWDIPEDNLVYIGTIYPEPLVFHVFEKVI
jgi:hypothetical protein